MKKVLMVVLDFPPCKSAGVQRTLKFAEYLHLHGWEPIILTVNEAAHIKVDMSQIIPENVKHVYRSFSFNAARDFSINGKYLNIMKEPDRWWTWRYTAVPLGKKVIESLSPDVIWSTYPVSTAHNIAGKLAKWSGLPWIADFRDPIQQRYDKRAKKLLDLTLPIERKALINSTKVVFNTQQASLLYQSLYSDLPLNKFHVIQNGFDEGNFKKLEHKSIEGNESRVFTLLHSGAIYSNGRDPSDLFNALARLKKDKKISKDDFCLKFRGAAIDLYEEQINALDIADLMAFLPSINYMESLQEMMTANGLLVVQGALFNNQIPGKLFEYIRSGQPILAFTPYLGATARALKDVEMVIVAETTEQLEDAIIQLININVVSRSNIDRFSRHEKTNQLASLLNSVV